VVLDIGHGGPLPTVQRNVIASSARRLSVTRASDVLAIPLEAEAVDDYTSVDNPADAVGNVEKRGSRCAVWARPDGFAI